jgi:hypothetical protein
MGFWDDLNKGLKSNPITRVFSEAGEAVYNVVPKSENLAIGTYESGTTTAIPNPDPEKTPAENLIDGYADNTVEKIPGWDENKGITDNVVSGASNGVKVVTDAFSNAAKAAAELGSSATNGIKKWGPLALAGGLAFLLLRK